MTVVDHKWSALPVPYAVDVPDRVRKERYSAADLEGDLASHPA